MKDRLKVVLDTNVLLVSISSKSKYHWIYTKLVSDEYDLFITNEILMEYEEIISKKYNYTVARNVIKSLLILPNVHKTSIYYNWNLISEDRDDNKFVDCALNSNCHLLVTNDKHFQVLKTIDFPKIEVRDINYFAEQLGING
ncbi:MAG: putative toxin-antitoxin system toxin component, PIN family [Melioribacteraceae bacterium]|nr:putative toxin-antitoxin system toxin component, PIN family [Melioribacteraceae bacterium]MCF8394325.1 putative toxin-antitoxin system toxin component, PIN family [Melioribacteraceae bacterium]MCF8420004.1 putative toxin-antitoxin system toxin component, PIN family [Melioribacteraceae bacterium]